jgi:hypothetical protein
VADEAIDSEDVKALIRGGWDANRKLDEILRFIDDGEDEEIEPDA